VKITNQAAALRGATLIVVHGVAAAALWLLNTVAFRFLGGRGGEGVEGLMSLLWLGLAVLLAVGVIFVGTACDRPGFAWALVALIVVGELFSLAFTLSRVFAPGEFRFLSVLSVPSSLVGIAERVVFLVFLVSLCGPSRQWALIVALVGGGIGVLRGVFFMAMPFIGATGFLMSPAYPWVLGVLGLVTLGTSLALSLGARAAIADGSVLADGPGASAAQPAPVPEAPPASPGADFAIGAILLAVGIGVTVMSYAAASSGGGGGRYVIATGFIGVGLGRLIRGLIRASRAS
jgi:hypothetical protein